MVFNKDISGIQNEIEFVEKLNNKKVGELDPLFYCLIEDLYKEIDVNNIIKCWQNDEPQKSDIFISINNNIKGISIKKGVKNSIHVERISDFIHFLIENSISREVVISYLKYHYADGTTNGKGEVRLSVEEYKKEHQDEIDMINKSFNQVDIINKIIDRFILQGRHSTEKIDMLIYGVVNDFIWITAEDVRKLILSKIDVYSTAVHFGSLTVQPMNRCLNRNPLYESKRFCVQIKWYNISDDIIENMNDKIMEKCLD